MSQPILRYITGFFILICSCNSLVAQHQFDIWYFGDKAGLDFRSGTPIPLLDGQSNTLEGSSVASSPKEGNLLFYTDGVTVWNATHRPMPNGTGLLGHWTSAQSALIVPKPNDTTQYYIFTSGAGFYAMNPNNGVRYSVVDMLMDGGKGDVVQKNIELLPSGKGVEMLNATKHCNGQDYWVVAHELGTNRFNFYLITQSGITDTVTINIGSILSGDAGSQSMAKFSPNGRMLAVATPGEKTLELYDFDNATGLLSNHRMIANDWYFYSPEFSPDNSKLYISSLAYGSEPDYLYQFDLTSGDLASIQASRFQIHKEDGTWDGAQLQLAPNGKIYVSYIRRDSLGVITDPNAQGILCNYQHGGQGLGGRTTSYGLPNFINSDMPGVTVSHTDFELQTSLSTSSPSPGDQVSLKLILCNLSSNTQSVNVQLSLPPGTTYISGASNYPNHTFPSVPSGECDTVAIQVRIANAPVDSLLTICASVLDDGTTCTAPDTTCESFIVRHPIVDTAETDYTFHLLGQCPGTTTRTAVLFNSHRYTDTIVSISFYGLDARNFDYAGLKPIRFVIRPTTDQWIPITVRHTSPGPLSAIMQLVTSTNDTFTIRVNSETKASTTPFLDLSEIRVGSRPGVFDTCFVVRNISSSAVVIVDTAWLRSGSEGHADWLSPNLPIAIGPGKTTTLCLRITESQLDLNDTIIIGGSEPVEFCPHCFHSQIVVNNETGEPSTLGMGRHRQGVEEGRLSLIPNPLHNIGKAEFTLEHSSVASLILIDTKGSTIKEIFINLPLGPGKHIVPFSMQGIPSGAYFAQIRTRGFTQTIPVQVID